LGTDFIKVALVSPGQAFQIVGNVNSKRKTSTTVSFYQGDRIFEADAESLLPRRPRQVFHAPHRLLGRNASHPSVIDYINSSYYATSVQTNSRGGLDFIVPGEWRAPAPGSAAALKAEAAEAALIEAAGPEGAEAAKAAAKAAAAEPTLFSAEEMVAQLFIHIKDFTELHAGGGLKVRDVVLTVPSFFTQNERVALLDAAELAGLKVLALIDENAAAGVHYGIDRVTENTTHYMILYNMGDEDTEATLFAYDSYQAIDKTSSKPKAIGQGRILAKSWDTSLGGRQFDKALVEYVADSFNRDKGKTLPASAKGDVRNLPGSMVKIKKNVQKALEVLSANEEYSLTVEGVHGDVDYRVQVNRAILDKAVEEAGLWKRVVKPLEDLVLMSNLSLANVTVVEIVGGGVRVPKVQAILKDFLAEAKKSAGGVGAELGTHLNGDEVMALGAAFAAANRSATFRVRKVGMIDGFPFPIGVRLQHLDPTAVTSVSAGEDAAAAAANEGDAPSLPGKPWVKRSSLFRAYNTLDSVKRISFSADHDLRATLFYENVTMSGSGAPPLPEGTSRTVGIYNITGIDKLLANETIVATGGLKVHISFELSESGIASVLKAEATQDIETLVPEPVVPIVTPKAKVSSNSSDENSTDTNVTATEAASTPAIDTNETATNTTDSNGTATNDTISTEPKMRVVKKTLKYPLIVTLDKAATSAQVQPMSSEEKAVSLARLAKLREADDEKKKLDGAKNALESFVYAIREKRDAEEESIALVTSEEQRESLGNVLMEIEEWLYGDGASADYATYKNKLAESKASVDPIFVRVEELKARPQLLENTKSTIDAWYEMIAAWNRTHPQVSLYFIK
jgi:hypoxia up-regulated 1